jgi:hypothetical protein
MNTERIKELAVQAGLEFDDDLVLESEPIYYTSQKDLEKFAKLIAAEEREACAKVCEEHPDGLNMLGGAFVTCAAAIRARGNE